jgi:hypothetical protein
VGKVVPTLNIQCKPSNCVLYIYIYMHIYLRNWGLTQGLTLARQMLLPLEPLLQSFCVCVGFFEIGSYKLFPWDWL